MSRVECIRAAAAAFAGARTDHLSPEAAAEAAALPYGLSAADLEARIVAERASACAA